MFHITNGEQANAWLQGAGIAGEYLAWDDVLHEGPVPAGLSLHDLSLIRARFISFCGWATEFEAQTHFQTRDARFLEAARNKSVVIWNSHELFDQLHMLQVLSWYCQQGAQLPPPRIVFVDALLGAGELDNAALEQALIEAQPATTEQLACADQLWQLFSAGNPRGLAAAAAEPVPEFPYMQQALERLLAEYPDEQGLSLTERRILEAVAAGHDDPVAMFRAVRDAEAVPFMGDASFWLIVQGLCSTDQPLLTSVQGVGFILPDLFAPDAAFREQRLQLTNCAQMLLAGEGNWLDTHMIDRWVGGVHLNPENRWLYSGAGFRRY